MSNKPKLSQYNSLLEQIIMYTEVYKIGIGQTISRPSEVHCLNGTVNSDKLEVQSARQEGDILVRI